MKKQKPTQNSQLLILISICISICEIILSTFLFAYFFKLSGQTSLPVLLYSIANYLTIGTFGSLIVARLAKNHSRVRLLRIGIILHFLYILIILNLKENIIHYIFPLSIFLGIGQSFYWIPFHLLSINKINSNGRIKYSTNLTTAKAITNLIFPTIFGFIINTSSFTSALFLISIISAISVLASLLIADYKLPQKTNFKIKKVFSKIKRSKVLKKLLITDFLSGFSTNGGVLSVLTVSLIYNINQSNLDLGIIETISLSFILILSYSYGKTHQNKNDSFLTLIYASIASITIFSIFITSDTFILISCIIITKIFQTLLLIPRRIRTYSALSNSKIIPISHQAEYISIREFLINFGRSLSYLFTILIVSFFPNFLLPFVVSLSIATLLQGLIIASINKSPSQPLSYF